MEIMRANSVNKVECKIGLYLPAAGITNKEE